MSTFKSDFILTMDNENKKYLNKINLLFEDESFLTDISINEAGKLIEYLRTYKHLINSLCSLIDNINNIKKTELLNDKIEAELYLKIFPIMNIYRLLLNEKYKNEYDSTHSSIMDQD